MTRDDLRSLRVQAGLILGMFVGCAAVAGGVATQRAWFESHLKEDYVQLPSNLAPLAEKAAGGRLVEDDLAELTPPLRLAIYDNWMVDAAGSAQTPRALVSADPALYLARAERSLVCGNASQRQRAIAFLTLCGSPEAVPILEKAQRWAARRAMTVLADQIGQALSEIERRTPAEGSAGSSGVFSAFRVFS